MGYKTNQQTNTKSEFMFYNYFKKSISAFVLLFFLLPLTLVAQVKAKQVNDKSFGRKAISVTGTVVDPFGRGLANAQVTVAEKSGLTAVSDQEGVFTISVDEGDKLIVNYLGYYPYQKRISAADATLMVRLDERYLTVTDTTKVLYGAVKTEDNLASISTIHTRQLLGTPASSYSAALAGRLAGLHVKQNSGYRNPYIGGLTRIVDQFIGIVSPDGKFGSNFTSTESSDFSLTSHSRTPITIIDGVQRDFTSIDFDNIESISILKDAMSTIMLGQRSSSPVLLITTTQPSKGAPRISFSAQYGLQQSLSDPKPLSAYEYAYLYNEALLGSGNTTIYKQADFDAYRNNSDPIGHPDNNWKDILLKKTAPISRYSFNVNGGNNIARYVVSLGYLSQDGLFNESTVKDYSTALTSKRYTVNSSIDVNVNKNFNVALQLFGRIQDGNQPGLGYSSLYSSMITTPSNAYPITNPNGTYGGNKNFTSNLYARTFASGYTLDNARDVLANLNMVYKFDSFIKGLYARIQGNTTAGTTSTIIRTENSIVYERVVGATGTVAYNPFGSSIAQSNDFNLSSNYQTTYAQAAIGLDKTFGNHSLKNIILADQKNVITNFDLPFKHTNIAAKSSYNYKGKYFAEAALTYSGYDRIQEGSRFGFFYAGSLGYKISEESFIKDNAKWIDLLKVRLNYGKTGGNDNIGYFGYRGFYTQTGAGSYNFGTGVVNIPGLTEQPNLTTVNATWEKAHKLNLGVDFNILKNALNFTADYYRDRFYDLSIQRGQTSSLIGNTYPNENIGITRYTGADFQLTYQNNKNSFNYFITANASLEQSKVIFKDEVIQKYAYNVTTGYPTDAIFGYVADGLLQTSAQAAVAPTFQGVRPIAGDIKYIDQNGDGIISDYDQVLIGNIKPKVYYGTTLGFNYKGLDFSVMVQGVLNNQITTNDYTAFLANNGQGYERLLGRWTPENGANATLPRLRIDGQNTIDGSPYVMSTYWLKDNNYIRIKNVELGYSIPRNLLAKIHISGLRVFVSGLNLFTIAQYKDADPEIGITSYPIQRVYNAGVSLKL